MKLTLRELFLLVVIAAMGCGWWVDHRRANGLAEREAQQYQVLSRVSRAWEDRANALARMRHDLDNADKLRWRDDNIDPIGSPPYYVVRPNGEEYTPNGIPAEQRLFRLIAILEAKGFRINFQQRLPRTDPGFEEISVETMPTEGQP